jgi:hypothetical protein
MRSHLALLGPTVQTSPAGADFTVRGQVRAVPIPDNKQRIEVQWLIKNAAGQDLGRVVQLNEIPAGTLDHAWGDVAGVVATEASGGVNDVIKRQTQPDTATVPVQAQQPAVQNATVRGQPGTPALEGQRSGVQPVR